MAIYRGIAHVITKGQSISQFPEAFRTMIRGDEASNLNFVPLAVMLAIAAVGAVYLSRLAAGRRVYAVGGNEEASRFSGVSIARVKLSVFIIAGLTAGISALLNLGYYGSGGSSDGAGYELKVIAAAVVGGASLSGGRGTAFGALLGAVVIAMLESGIVILGINSDYSEIIIGIAIILAVVFDQLSSRLALSRELRNT